MIMNAYQKRVAMIKRREAVNRRQRQRPRLNWVNPAFIHAQQARKVEVVS